MSDFLDVVPVEGRKLPLEENPRRYVTKRQNVPNRSYYRRAIRRGDLKLYKPKAQQKMRKKTSTED